MGNDCSDKKMEEKKIKNILTLNNIKPPVEGRCGFFVKRKQRYCKMLPAKGNTHCAEHLAFQDENRSETSIRKRIVCPLDNKHSIFEDNLKKHLKKCNATIKVNLPYYEKNINIGLKDHKYQDDDNIALCDTSVEVIKELIIKVKETVKRFDIQEPQEDYELHASMSEEINKEEYGDSVKKHALQQASLINIMSKNYGCKNKASTVIEFGAGRGGLSHWVQKSIFNSNSINHKFFLVDRQQNRHKFDCYHKCGDQSAKFERLNIDIQHLNLAKVDSLVIEDTSNICAIGKHLCGGATDLSLRCLLGKEDSDDQTVEPEQKKLKYTRLTDRFKFCLFALCCYHRCTWATYVGKEFFLMNNFTDIDFLRITKMATWATCGFNRRDFHDQEDSIEESKSEDLVSNSKNLKEEQDKRLHVKLNLTTDEQKEIGKMCKRLIDFGRLEYISKKKYSCKLLKYIDDKITLENIVLIISENELL